MQLISPLLLGLTCPWVPFFSFYVLQYCLAKGERSEPEKLLMKRRILNLERLLSTSEPVIFKGSELNDEVPFLPERDAEKKMIEKPTAHTQMNVKSPGGCRPCGIGMIIDVTSRFLFPFSFVMFNFFYWHHYLTK